MKIKVEGTEYDFPAIDSLTMDETILLERVSGVGVELLAPGDSLPMGAVKAFVMIAVMRARPDVSERELAASIGKIKLNEMADLVQKEDDARPPELTETSDATSTSGDASSSASASSLAVVPPPATGAQDSPTSNTSDRETLAG